MELDKHCIVECFERAQDMPHIDNTLKVFYKNKHIDKYSELIDKDRIYTMEEANELFKANSTYGFEICSKSDSNKGSEMIAELACLEERADLNFKTLNYYSVEEYIKEISEEGYRSEKLTQDEFDEWLEFKMKRIGDTE